MPVHETPYIGVEQHGKRFLLTRLPAGLVTRISYASVRGRDNELGAVQRYLNPRRITSIRDFTLGGGDFPSAIVLNWVDRENPLTCGNGVLRLNDAPRSAQLIDGQHRVAGLQAAIAENRELMNFEVPVVIYENLDTQQCANIFLSINTEQKPVPRSLVFDLYGVADEQIVDSAAHRARDIAIAFNEEEGSPYRELIKMPGAPRMKGGIALSTAVTAIKPLVDEKGDLEQAELRGLNEQKQVILNFFLTLQEKYGGLWFEKTNAFIYASGFLGALDFFRIKMIPYCYARRTFTVESMNAVLDLGPRNLILQEEVKGVGGKDAPKRIYARLVDSFEPIVEPAEPIRIN